MPIVVQAAFGVVLLPLKTQAEVGSAVIGGGTVGVFGVVSGGMRIPAAPESQVLFANQFTLLGVQRLWCSGGVVDDVEQLVVLAFCQRAEAVDYHFGWRAYEWAV